MSITWSDLRDQVRRSILDDDVANEDGDYKWSDEVLRDLCGWALDTFADHTAYASSVIFTPATSVSYTLPDNMYDGEIFDLTGVVWLLNSDDKSRYLDPVRYTDELDERKSEGFYTYPNNTLNLQLEDDPDYDSLHVNYYAYYDHPILDADVINTPQWANTALSYLIGAHALSGGALKSSQIRRGAKPDTGNPEHNPVMEQQKWFISMYEKELSRYAPQDRINYHRESKRA